MSHTLHRLGNVEELQHDFVVFAMPSSGLNSKGSKPKLQQVYHILKKHDPVNVGDSKNGSRFSLGSDEEVEARIIENELVHGVFSTREQVIAVLKDLKEADLGLSVTVSGLTHTVTECCHQAGLTPHTIVQSLGVMGRTDLLPEDENVTKLATMCGHGMISFNLILDLAEKVRAGKLTPEAAAEKMAKPCICGVFNPKRTAEILREFI